MNKERLKELTLGKVSGFVEKARKRKELKNNSDLGAVIVSEELKNLKRTLNFLISRYTSPASAFMDDDVLDRIMNDIDETQKKIIELENSL